MLIGIPWLVFVTAVHASHIGRFSLYAGGDDMWMFQRWAYRIYLQGYWLQGGELTFWFQPFYRWIAGALHLVFGDSSMGEFWWDAICLMVFALFAHQAVAAANGFKWGLAAAALCLTVAMQGPPCHVHRPWPLGYRVGRLHLPVGADPDVGAPARRGERGDGDWRRRACGDWFLHPP